MKVLGGLGVELLDLPFDRAVEAMNAQLRVRTQRRNKLVLRVPGDSFAEALVGINRQLNA